MTVTGGSNKRMSLAALIAVMPGAGPADLPHPLVPGEVYHAFGYVKKAAALANGAAGQLPAWKADLIARVAEEVIDGELDAHRFLLLHLRLTRPWCGTAAATRPGSRSCVMGLPHLRLSNAEQPY